MTILAGFSSSRQGSRPLNLAAQLPPPPVRKVIAAAIVERALPARADPIEDQYQGLRHVPGNWSLQRVVDRAASVTSTSP